jgi:hypothetical protein
MVLAVAAATVAAASTSRGADCDVTLHIAALASA